MEPESNAFVAENECELVHYQKEKGYSIVEMECVAMAACTNMRNILFGQILFTADSLANVKTYNIRNEENEF